MKRLSKYTNVIPIYTKGDYLDQESIPDLKMKLNVNAQNLGMEWFNCKEVRLLLTLGTEERREEAVSAAEQPTGRMSAVLNHKREQHY